MTDATPTPKKKKSRFSDDPDATINISHYLKLHLDAVGTILHKETQKGNPDEYRWDTIIWTLYHAWREKVGLKP